MGFKKRSKSALSLADKVSEMTQKTSQKDEAEWKLTVDKAGNGSAVIRFLPHKDDDKIPFVKMINHGYKENGRWFIENCPTLHGKDCPVCAANTELWATEVKSNRDIAGNRKRKISYWANILIITDKANPESQGKVFKYRFGVKILEKIAAHSKGDEDLGEDEINVDCVYEGANFSLKAQQKDNYQNYDLSKFGAKCALFEGDEGKLEELFDSMHDIDDVANEKHLLSYADLEKAFDKFNGAKGSKKIASAAESLPSSDEELDAQSADKEADLILDNSENAGDELDDLDALMKELE
ncbi:single-stranded DNA binding protein [Paraglaciecola Antarctic GD virus 1]|nr:single-stranded DNA binding protein [Paraglaciecola Antarctic GD virus 1]